MSNRTFDSLKPRIAAITASATVALLASCSQSPDEQAAAAADAAMLTTPTSTADPVDTTEMPEIVIVASREKPRTRG
jgi:ABC-type glycerol-3-phosphate transport system substrate-binding protein